MLLVEQRLASLGLVMPQGRKNFTHDFVNNESIRPVTKKLVDPCCKELCTQSHIKQTCLNFVFTLLKKISCAGCCLHSLKSLDGCLSQVDSRLKFLYLDYL